MALSRANGAAIRDLMAEYPHQLVLLSPRDVRGSGSTFAEWVDEAAARGLEERYFERADRYVPVYIETRLRHGLDIVVAPRGRHGMRIIVGRDAASLIAGTAANAGRR